MLLVEFLSHAGFIIVLCLSCEQDGFDQLQSMVPGSGNSSETSASGSRSKNSKADLLRKCEYDEMGGSGWLG